MELYNEDCLEGMEKLADNSPPRPVHPTQKPVDLLEYMIRTYTDEGETVLDATMGSGSTGVACMNTGRNFIGFEFEKKYFDIARKRIDDAIAEREQSLFKLGVAT